MEQENQTTRDTADDSAETSSQTTPDPARVLEAYGEGRANQNDVMRALVSYRGWYVPLNFYAGWKGQDGKVDSMLLLSPEAEVRPGELWLFTDEEAARLAASKGAQLGNYVARMAGTDMFPALQSEYQTVWVNPGSPPERTWLFQQGSAGSVGGLWAEAVALEESFAEWQRTGEPDVGALEDYRAFMLYDFVSGPVVTLPNQAGMTNPAAAFTAPDCAEAFLSALSEEQRAQLRPVTIDGKTLLANLPRGVDGLLFNLFGPGPTYALRLSAGEES
jgi:hypothetical protein